MPLIDLIVDPVGHWYYHQELYDKAATAYSLRNELTEPFPTSTYF